jgi:hypothetical protein
MSLALAFIAVGIAQRRSEEMVSPAFLAPGPAYVAGR